jgi:hypothetical protein
VRGWNMELQQESQWDLLQSRRGALVDRQLRTGGAWGPLSGGDSSALITAGAHWPLGGLKKSNPD